jgi:Na+/H+ antiporter NhaD/arsenite permease-like protein
MQTTIAVAIFLLTYAVLITDKINRAVIALTGAVMLILFGILNAEEVFTHYMEWDTLALLVGMMIIVGVTNKTGVFQYVAVKSAKAAKGSPIRILIILSLLTAVASAFLDNVTTVLLLVPVTFSITKILGVNPVPFLISQVIASNIGGTATLIGDPPNIMIGSANKHLTFNQFILNLTPVIAVILTITLFLLYLIYRRQLKVTSDNIHQLMELNERDYIENPVLMKKALFVLAITILGFVLHSVIHVEASVIAMSGATLLMLIGLKEDQVEEAFQSVEWVSIFFFAGLFTLVGGLQKVGMMELLARKVLDVTNGDIPLAAILILWVSGVASAFIDNIPFVATMIPLIKDMAAGLGLATNSPEINVLWWSLSLGACLGGNGTLIGASANIVVASIAERQGKGFRFLDFLKVGAPLTLVSLIISNLYIYMRYLIHLQ